MPKGKKCAEPGEWCRPCHKRHPLPKGHPERERRAKVLASLALELQEADDEWKQHDAEGRTQRRLMRDALPLLQAGDAGPYLQAWRKVAEAAEKRIDARERRRKAREKHDSFAAETARLLA